MKWEISKIHTLAMAILQNRFILVAFVAFAPRHTFLAMTLPSNMVTFAGYNAIWIAITLDATAIQIVRCTKVSDVTFFAQITHIARLTNATDTIPLEGTTFREITLRFRTRTRLTATDSVRFTVEAFVTLFAFSATRVIRAQFTFTSLLVAHLASAIAITWFCVTDETLKIDNSFVDQKRRFLSPTIVTVGRILTRCAIVRSRTLTYFNTDGYVIR